VSARVCGRKPYLIIVWKIYWHSCVSQVRMNSACGLPMVFCGIGPVCRLCPRCARGTPCGFSRIDESKTLSLKPIDQIPGLAFGPNCSKVKALCNSMP